MGRITTDYPGTGMFLVVITRERMAGQTGRDGSRLAVSAGTFTQLGTARGQVAQWTPGLRYSISRLWVNSMEGHYHLTEIESGFTGPKEQA